MRCEEFQRRLHRLLDNRTEPEWDWALISHAGDCEACRQDLHDCQAVSEAMRMHQAPGLPGSFAEAVVSQATAHSQTLDLSACASPSQPIRPTVRRRPDHSRFFAGYGGSVAISAAALLLLVCGLAVFVTLPSRGHGVDAGLAVGKRASVASKPRLAIETASTHGEDKLAGTKPVRESGGATAGLMSALEPLASFSDIQSDEIPGVRPLMNSFDVTMSLLKRTIPRHGAARKQPATSYNPSPHDCLLS